MFLKHPGQTCDLNRISQCRPRPVRFDIAHRSRINFGRLPRASDDIGLGSRIRYRVSVRLAPMVDGCSFNDPINVIPVGYRLGHRFKQHGPNTFTGHIAVSALAEAFTPPLARYKIPLSQQQVFVRMNRDVHAAGDGHLALSLPQTLTSQMNRSQ
ncbi:hypothetical protein D3C72_1015370 [compost metagenome]